VTLRDEAAKVCDVTAERGIGVARVDSRLVDPRGLMNPGKIFFD
jgi:hypothetical protein